MNIRELLLAALPEDEGELAELAFQMFPHFPDGPAKTALGDAVIRKGIEDLRGFGINIVEDPEKGFKLGDDVQVLRWEQDDKPPR